MASGTECRQCGSAMTAGFAAVSVDGAITPLLWVAGELTRGFLRGPSVDGRERAAIRALRCPECGHVAFVAPPAASDAGAEAQT
ncbi:MAG: hypothetical protein M3081_20305 [Gemmatimonadota bacterium]|nr:hypothetical protein [Gemmatimonadota bacterium]